MILAFDTCYSGNTAKTVCVAFHNWTDDSPAAIYSETTEHIAAYIPGEFYKRELPCILSLLKKIDHFPIEAIIVDGFVYLDDEHQPGLGAHLYNNLDKRIPVIGVAKTNFATLQQNKREVFRGNSKRPLYVTTTGMDIDEAAKLVESMTGEHRIPLLLKKLDMLTREEH